MSQLTFTQDMGVAYPGQIQDISDCQIVNYIAGSDIEPGRVVEVDPVTGKINYPQATTLGRVAGVSMYISAALPQSWKTGDQVPVLRKGRVYATLSGGTVTHLLVANVKHSSTLAVDRGKVSASATSAVAGSEVSALGSVIFVRPATDPTLALLELNLP